MFFLRLVLALVEVWQIVWVHVHRAQHQHFPCAFSSVPFAARVPPRRLLQLQFQLQLLRQHPHHLQPQLGNAPTMTQGLEIVAMNAAAARTQAVGLVSFAKDRQQVTIVHLTVQAQMKTWLSHAWIGLLAATQ